MSYTFKEDVKANNIFYIPISLTVECWDALSRRYDLTKTSPRSIDFRHSLTPCTRRGIRRRYTIRGRQLFLASLLFPILARACPPHSPREGCWNHRRSGTFGSTPLDSMRSTALFRSQMDGKILLVKPLPDIQPNKI